MSRQSKSRLGVGFIGSGFMTRFHIRSFQAVRDADILGVWSPNATHAEEAATLARELGVGQARVHGSLADLVSAKEIDAIWVVGPNHLRVAHFEEICGLLQDGKADLLALACEKPLARNVAEARQIIELMEKTDLLHGYLENQVFTPSVTRGREIIWRRGAAIAGRPYLARAAEEHSGPHAPWFWQGEKQGGGVLTDMLCHSIEAGRFLLTDPDKPRNSLRIKSVAGQIASLKWTRKEYVELLKESMGGEVDFGRSPVEDFARGTITFMDDAGHELILEATSSWSFVGPGLRLTFELLGPEYALNINSLDTSLKVFLSRRVQGKGGEDLVEKQNAEQGLMPVLDNEPAYYGYEAENRHMVRAFLAGESPSETLHDGLAVIETLMSLYLSAEEGRRVDFPPPGLESFVPQVASGSWDPHAHH